MSKLVTEIDRPL